MKGQEIDSLLKAYLGPDEPESETDEAQQPTASVAEPEGSTQPPTPIAEPEPQAPAVAPDLRDLLARYLDTFPGDGDDSRREFALPRSTEIDELLRRQVVDSEDVAGELTSSLRAHLEARGPDADGDQQPQGASAQWAQVAASTQHGMLTLDERLARYAHAYAEQDEQAHTFGSADDSTIKGVPPPNAPPIPVGSPMAKQIKSKTPPRGLKKDR